MRIAFGAGHTLLCGPSVPGDKQSQERGSDPQGNTGSEYLPDFLQ